MTTGVTLDASPATTEGNAIAAFVSCGVELSFDLAISILRMVFLVENRSCNESNGGSPIALISSSANLVTRF